MTAMTRPTPGRLSFHRLSVSRLLDSLLADEARHPSHPDTGGPCYCAETIATYLRPMAYLACPIGRTA